MSVNDDDLTARAASLRRDFDASFARAAQPAPAFEDFLAARIGDGAYAIALSAIAGVHRDRKITPIRSRAAHLLGVAAFRGTTAPIYDLREILGHSATSPPRWLVLAQAASAVGFAFDALEGHLRIEVGTGEIDRAGDRFVQGVVRAKDRAFSVLRLTAIVESIVQDCIT